MYPRRCRSSDLPANSTWTCPDRSSLSLPTGEGDGVYGIVWLGPNLSVLDVGRNEPGYIPFFVPRRDNICRGSAIARTRAICPRNIPHGMPSVCRGFVSASFRFLRQHGGLSLIYPLTEYALFSFNFLTLRNEGIFIPL